MTDFVGQSGGVKPSRANREQRVLGLSIVITMILAATGVSFGLAAGSNAVLFDGMYALVDAFMATLGLGVARLIAASNVAAESGRWHRDRFTMGFWHLEPMVLGFNGILLTAAATYGLLDGIDSFLRGGRTLKFETAAAYALLSTAVDVSMALYTTRANRTINSQLVALDTRSWVMTAALGGGLLGAFGIGLALRGTAASWLLPYIDPLVLIVICLAVIPVPFTTVRRNC